MFDLLLATGETFEDSGFTCAHMAAHSPHTLFLAGHESSTGLLDLRTRQLAWVNATAHAKKVCASKCLCVCETPRSCARLTTMTTNHADNDTGEQHRGAPD